MNEYLNIVIVLTVECYLDLKFRFYICFFWTCKIKVQCEGYWNHKKEEYANNRILHMLQSLLRCRISIENPYCCSIFPDCCPRIYLCHCPRLFLNGESLHHESKICLQTYRFSYSRP